MDPGRLFQIITNSTLLATRLLPAGRTSSLLFSSPHYCAAVPEDLTPGAAVLAVSATHTQGEEVRYSITGGNDQGLFSIHQRSGAITLAGALDHELCDKHELVVTAEGGAEAAVSVVLVKVVDVNDNPPVFLQPEPRIMLVEEDDRDLPATVAKVEAVDADECDAGRLAFRVSGDGAGQPSDGESAYFTINAHTGDLIQLKVLDRDPPRGRGVWRLRVEVRDGQWGSGGGGGEEAARAVRHHYSFGHPHRQASWGHREPGPDSSPDEETKGTVQNSGRNCHGRRREREPGPDPLPAEGTKGTPQDSGRGSHGRKRKRGVSRPNKSSGLISNALVNSGRNVAETQESRGTIVHRKNMKQNDKAKGHILRRLRSSNDGQRPGTGLPKQHKSQKPDTKTEQVHDGKGLSGCSEDVIYVFDNQFQRFSSVHTSGSSRVARPAKVLRNVGWMAEGLKTRRREGQLREGDGGHLSPVTEEALTTRDTSDFRELQTPLMPDFRDAHEVAGQRMRREWPLHEKIRGRGLGSQGEGTQLAVLTSSHLQDYASINHHTSKSKDRATLATPPLTAEMGYGQEEGVSKGQTSASLGIAHSLIGRSSPPVYVAGSRARRDVSRHAPDTPLTQDGGCDAGMTYCAGGGGGGGRVHVAETVVTVVVKDINDNAPIFPNDTLVGSVPENAAAGTPVVKVTARDADDTQDGSNARLTYDIEKNVVVEASGAALFSVDPHTGLVRTARCCLDREATPEYRLQVVAADGGGLKGTCTVVVRVDDVNDNPPRLARRHWKVEVAETDNPLAAAPHPPNTTLLELTASDRDEDTHFLYRVEPQSGPGWDNFEVRSVGSAGQLLALRSLDYEQEAHRRGFKFRVQVTDKGPQGWEVPVHVDSAWVTVLLKDVNDNPPMFLRPHVDVTVSEDAAPGTLLAFLPAQDADEGGQQGIDYSLEGGWGALTVDTEGSVRLVGPLDREAPGGAVGEVLVVAVDRGIPTLSATATLTITVEDINDCPPTLLPPTVLHVTEGDPPALLSVLKATDPDVWALGHGPPFTLSLAPSNPAHVLSLISLKFDPRLDSGRGGAELWTVAAVDREQHRQLSVAVRVSDAQGLAATHQLTVLVDDLNDNPMKPAAKSVYLWKTQGGGGSEAPLGRVFVEDPDDWDLEDKEFEWAGSPHPLFSLQPSDGTIVASSELREGRYDLQFSVSDRAWRQQGVTANVTVTVQTLPAEALTHAVPLTLTPITPEDLTRGWSPSEGGGTMSTLLKAVREALDKPGNTVEVVSVYPGDSGHTSTSPLAPAAPVSPITAVPSTCVWVNAKDARGRFMNPLKLQGLLALHTRQLEAATGVSVVVAEDTTSATAATSQSAREDPASGEDEGTRGGLYTASSLASTGLPLQVVDTNASSLITPRLTRAHACHNHYHHHHNDDSTACTPTSCLNGGRCVRTVEGVYRCVCPGETEGAQCKLLSRTFWGFGWVWLRPLPPCLPITLSLRLLTRHPHGLLLYAGPLSPTSRHATPQPMLALQLVDGRPQALLEGGGSPVKLQVNASLHDGHWHTLHLALHHQVVVMMVDLCGRGWKDEHVGDAHCLARARWNPPSGGGTWLGSGPLQVGGLAHAPPEPLDHGWRETPTRHNLNGCLSRLTVNTQVMDLGAPAHSHASARGCRPQHAACQGGCGVRGHCVGGLRHPHCECEPGWTGPGCAAPTTPARFDAASYLKVALSFSPGPWVVRVQVRVRLRGARTGLLVQLATHHSTATLTLHLQAGVACGAVSGAEVALQRVCVERHPLGDGAWHTITAERHGHNLRLSVDDGDSWRCNETLPHLAAFGGLGPPTPLKVDKQGGVTVGGIPSFVGVDLVTVYHDLQDACLDDLRVSGHRLPLPPALNTTSWGQMTTAGQLAQGCRPREDPCTSARCTPPLTCTPAWDQPSCSCGPGKQLVGDVCEDVDECQWQPCLYGGSCQNLRPGFLCVCEPGHLGDHCQWVVTPREAHPLAIHASVAVLALSLLLLVVLAVLLSLLLRRLRQARTVPERHEDRGLMGRVTGKGEARADLGGIHDTQLELIKLKSLGVVPSFMENNPMASRREGSSEVSIFVTARAPPTPSLLDPATFLPAESPGGCSYEVDTPCSSPSSYGSLKGGNSSSSAGQRTCPTSDSPHHRSWQ